MIDNQGKLNGANQYSTKASDFLTSDVKLYVVGGFYANGATHANFIQFALVVDHRDALAEHQFEAAGSDGVTHACRIGDAVVGAACRAEAEVPEWICPRESTMQTVR